MEFFNQAISLLKVILTLLGAGSIVLGGVNLLEAYGNDNPGAKSQGIKQLLAGGGIILIAITLVPLLSGILK